MGEGHKVHGKGQNDIYMCKVDVALNSTEAKSALDPSIRVHYGSTSGATLTSRQISNSVGKTLMNLTNAHSWARLNASKALHIAKSQIRSPGYATLTKYQGGNEYECHIATFNSRVVLKGSFH